MINKLYEILESKDINFSVGDLEGENFFIFDNWDDIETLGDVLDNVELGFSDIIWEIVITQKRPLRI